MFKRLFNWIKFKTLPPSINFKNRLFLERDSKSRRITNNLGLTFRNSKWADYTRTDINLNLRYSYKQVLSLLLALILMLCFFIYAIKFYNPGLLSNDVAFFIWSLKDLLTYHIFTFLTLLSLTLTVILEKFYINCIGWFFLKVPEVKFLPQKPIFTYPKSQDLRYVIYYWFQGSKSTLLPSVLESLVGTTPKGDPSNPITIDFKNLFGIANSLLSTEVGTTHVSNSFKTWPNAPISLPADTELTNLAKKNLEFLNTRTEWVSKGIGKVSLKLHPKKGSFNIGVLNYSRLQGLVTRVQFSSAFEDTLKSQLSLVKSTRLLYNYSFLHRKLLKNTHKLTTTKRLLGVTWYDSKLTLKNIWASDLFAGLSNPQTFLQSGLGLSYGSLVNDLGRKSYLKGIHTDNQSSNSFNNFCYYEESLFWLVKRIYSFNNLTAVNNSLGFYLKYPNTGLLQNRPSLGLNSATYPGALADNLFTINLLEKSYPTTSSKECSSRDFFISFWENELFSNGDEHLLAEFTSSPTYNQNLLPLFLKSPNLRKSPTNWELIPVKDYSLNINPVRAVLYVEDPLFSYTQDLLLQLFLTRK